MSELKPGPPDSLHCGPDEGVLSKLISYVFVLAVIGFGLVVGSPIIWGFYYVYMTCAGRCFEAVRGKGLLFEVLVPVLFATLPLLLVGLIIRAIVRRMQRRDCS